jgi:hypothetical protein
MYAVTSVSAPRPRHSAVFEEVPYPKMISANLDGTMGPRVHTYT